MYSQKVPAKHFPGLECILDSSSSVSSVLILHVDLILFRINLEVQLLQQGTAHVVAFLELPGWAGIVFLPCLTAVCTFMGQRSLF